MQRFLALTRKEAGAIFTNPMVLFAAAFFVLVDSFAFYTIISTQRAVNAEMDDMALFMLFTLMLMCPLVTMASFSEDIAAGNLETLLTAPIGKTLAVLAKFCGALLFTLVFLLHAPVYAALVSVGGNLDWRAAFAAFTALVAFAAFALALGVFASSLTVSSLAAAAGSGGVLLLFALASGLNPYSSATAGFLQSLSFLPHAKRWIAGEFDTRGLVYFITGAALFLLYARLAIGSRSLEKRKTNSVARRRRTATFALVSAGFVLLLAQAAVLHVEGFWEIGMPLDRGMHRIPRPYLLPLACAAAAFVWSFFTHRAARRAERDTAIRRTRYATISETKVMGAPSLYYRDDIRARRRVIVAAVAGLVIVVNLNWLAHYPFQTFAGGGSTAFLSALHERRWDVTHDKRNSLSPTTRNTLDMLQGRVDVYSFLPDDLVLHNVPVAEEMRRLLDRYADRSPLVSVTYADARREPILARDLAGHLSIRAEGLEDRVVIEYQGRRLALAASVLVSPPDRRRQLAGDTHWVFDGENRVTQTLVRLADPRTPNVFFSYGHLEHDIAADGDYRHSVARLADAMQNANMRVRQHQLTAATPIPPDCNILVIAAPRRPFGVEECEVIRDYLAKGGRMLVLGPEAGTEYAPLSDPFAALLFELGGSFRHDRLEDWDNFHQDNPRDVLAVGKVAGENLPDLVFTETRSIRDNPLVDRAGWKTERTVESHATATAQSFTDNSIRRGPFTLAYRSTRQTPRREARVAVVASGRMASDAGIGRGPNEAFLMRLTQWLAGREETRDIGSRRWVDRRLTLTGPQYRAIMWIGVIGLPLIWLLAGITVWWRRRDS